MTVTVYRSGDVVRSSSAFVNTAGQPTDPTTLTLKYKKDAGTTTSVLFPGAPIVKDSQGDYHADLDTSGWTGPLRQKWFIEWIGLGAVQKLGDDYWEVEPPTLT